MSKEDTFKEVELHDLRIQLLEIIKAVFSKYKKKYIWISSSVYRGLSTHCCNLQTMTPYKGTVYQTLSTAVFDFIKGITTKSDVDLQFEESPERAKVIKTMWNDIDKETIIYRFAYKKIFETE